MANPAPTPQVAWLNVKQAARLLGDVAVFNLYAYIDRGELTAYKIGGAWRIKVSDVEAYLQQARSKPRSVPS